MEHNDIRHKLSEYLDGSMTAREQAEIEEHLRTCQECTVALNELRKTIEQIKSIEEVEPPAWMTQKIMAKVRAEAEEKKSIFQRLFYPLIVKLPIQAVAVLFLAVTAFYIYHDINPTAKYAEAPMTATQELAAKRETPPVVPQLERKKSDGSLRRSNQVPQTPGYKSLDMKQEYEAPASPQLKDQIASSAPAPAKPAEQPVPEKKTMMAEKRAAAPLALSKAEPQEQNAAAGAAPRAKAKKEFIRSLQTTEGAVDKAGTDYRLERDIVEKYSNGNPKLVVTYEIINSRRVKVAEERFNSEGERDGIQKEYYASGQLKTEAEYGQGNLVWYMEYGQDGVKKVGKSDFDWFWLKK